MRNTNKMVLTAASVVAGLGLAGSAMADFDGYYTFNAGGTFFSAQTPISGSPWYLGNTAGGATGMKGVSGAGTSLGTFNPAPSGSLFLFGSGPGGGTGIPGTIEAWVTIDPSIAPNTTMAFNYLSAVETLGNGGTGDAVGWFYGPNLGSLTMHQLQGPSTGSSSGSVYVPVNAGDIFGWYVTSDAGAHLVPNLQINGFLGSAGVPEPATYVMNGLVLLGIGIGGFVSYKKSKKAKV